MRVAGTGHRPDKLGGYGDPIYISLVRFAIQELKALPIPPTQVISGMAQGWDTALAQAAINLNIPLIAAVPCEKQEHMWPLPAQKRYHIILSRAFKVEQTPGGVYQPWKMQLRNKWMVDNCDVLFALWNGTPGGTANCVDYAQKRASARIINVWPQWLTHVSSPRKDLDDASPNPT